MADATETVISWTFANWITVVLMGLVAFGIGGFGIKLIAARKSQ